MNLACCSAGFFFNFRFNDVVQFITYFIIPLPLRFSSFRWLVGRNGSQGRPTWRLAYVPAAACVRAVMGATYMVRMASALFCVLPFLHMVAILLEGPSRHPIPVYRFLQSIRSDLLPYLRRHRLHRRHLPYTPVTAGMHGPSVNILDPFVLQLRKSKVLARIDGLGLSFPRGHTMSVGGPLALGMMRLANQHVPASQNWRSRLFFCALCMTLGSRQFLSAAFSSAIHVALL